MRVFRKLMASLSAMLVAGSAAAFQPVIRIEPKLSEQHQRILDRQMQGAERFTSCEGMITEQYVMEMKARQVEMLRSRQAGDASEMCTVTFTINYSKENGEQPQFAMNAFNALKPADEGGEEYMGFWDESSESYSLIVPAGTYNLLFNVISKKGLIFICRENLVVNGDATVPIDIDDASNHITFTTLNTSGEEAAVDLLDPSTDDNTVLIPGNVENQTYIFYVHALYQGYIAAFAEMMSGICLRMALSHH